MYFIDRLFFQDQDYNHDAKLKDVAQELYNLSKSNLIKTLDISLSVSDLDDSARNPANPLRQQIPLESKNIFVDIIRHEKYKFNMTFWFKCFT